MILTIALCIAMIVLNVLRPQLAYSAQTWVGYRIAFRKDLIRALYVAVSFSLFEAPEACLCFPVLT